jgi:hypothetical protein
LRIGYNRAARLIEQMEAAGLVSPMGRNGTREVLAPGRPTGEPTMTATTGNLLRDVPVHASAEIFADLMAWRAGAHRAHVSNGQASAPDFWYDSTDDEWVLESAAVPPWKSTTARRTQGRRRLASFAGPLPPPRGEDRRGTADHLAGDPRLPGGHLIRLTPDLPRRLPDALMMGGHHRAEASACFIHLRGSPSGNAASLARC